MNIAAKIGLRYSYARRGSRFIALNAILSVLGIAIGIAALIVVLSVMNGVMGQVRNSILSFTSHMSVRAFGSNLISKDFNPQIFQQFPQITGYAPYVQGQALIGEGERFQGVLLEGIEPQQHHAVSKVFAKLSPEVKKALEDDFNIIIGEELAQQLNLNVGDKISLIVPRFSVTGAGVFPRMKRFNIVGTFNSGNYQYDVGYSFTNVSSVNKLLQQNDGYSGWQIMLQNPEDAPKFREILRQKLPMSTYISDWSIDNAGYFNAVQLEKKAMFIILSLIILVALFSLLSTMYMVVSEKKRDIAILRTMGMNRKHILLIFTTLGVILGGFGTILGVILGLWISFNIPYLLDLLEKIGDVRIDKTMYFVENLSAEVDPQVVYGVVLFTFAFTLLFSIIPAWIAARTQPAQALSQE